MKKSLSLMVAILIALPVFADTKSFMEKCLNSWVGYSMDEVMSSWGYPTGEREIAGKHLYFWNVQKVGYVPQTSNTYGHTNATANYYGYGSAYGNGTYNSTTTTYGGYSVTYYCNRTLEVDADNKVVSWQWEGNFCPSTYFAGKKWVNPQNDEWAKEKALKDAAKKAKKAKKQAAKQVKKQKKASKNPVVEENNENSENIENNEDN